MAKQNRWITETIEDGFDKAHSIVDTLTYPLGPLDAVVHGVSRGALNWVTGRHPERQPPCRSNTNRPKAQRPEYMDYSQAPRRPDNTGGGRRKTKVGNIKGFDNSPVEVGNIDLSDGETEIGDIEGFDNSGVRAGNIGRRR